VLWVNFDLDSDGPEKIKRFVSITTSDFYRSSRWRSSRESISGLPRLQMTAVRLRSEMQYEYGDDD
jgi:hypothetical protein